MVQKKKKDELVKKLIELISERYDLQLINNNYVTELCLDLKQLFNDCGIKSSKEACLIYIHNNQGRHFEFLGEEEVIEEYCKLYADSLIQSNFDRFNNVYELRVAKHFYYLLGMEPEDVDKKVKHLQERNALVDKLLSEGDFNQATDIYYNELHRIIGNKKRGLRACFDAAFNKEDYVTAKRVAELLDDKKLNKKKLIGEGWKGIGRFGLGQP